MSQVQSVSGESFQQVVLDSEIPVVIDFYATWCPPCKRLGPVLDRLAEEFAGKLKFVKVDSDQEYDLAEAFQVTALPTLVMMRGGKPEGQIAGAPDEDSFRRHLQQWVNEHAA